MTLNELKIGKSAKILKVGGEGALRRHFLDMGLIPGAAVRLVKFAPYGRPYGAFDTRLCAYTAY